jgi:hypothetical protein
MIKNSAAAAREPCSPSPGVLVGSRPWEDSLARARCSSRAAALWDACEGETYLNVEGPFFCESNAARARREARR